MGAAHTHHAASEPFLATSDIHLEHSANEAATVAHFRRIDAECERLLASIHELIARDHDDRERAEAALAEVDAQLDDDDDDAAAALDTPGGESASLWSAEPGLPSATPQEEP